MMISYYIKLEFYFILVKIFLLGYQMKKISIINFFEVLSTNFTYL